MNKRFLWTTAALLTAALGIPLSTHAESPKVVNHTRVDKQAKFPQATPPAPPMDVVKVGESQAGQAEAVVARIQPHQLSGRRAATIYVRDIPVLTFLSLNSVPKSSNVAQIKQPTVEDSANLSKQANVQDEDSQATNAPIWRATAVAAKLNQLSLTDLDASKIKVNWKAGNDANPQKLSERYVIKVNDEELVEINSETRLPDMTDNLAEEALQATNRLRRLLGNAPPLREIVGKPLVRPKLPQQISLGVVRIRFNGLASWYGPGFHGNRSASGEIYNQHALTAAHRSLPFGTKVKVTNTRTGRSLIVRINDRGPYTRSRIIDLSAAAARILGVMQSGVAPVRLEVLSPATTVKR